MSELSDVTELRVASQVLIEGYEFMRSAGRMYLEGMVLWAGKQQGQIFTITDLIIPKQKGLRTSEGVCAIVEADELRRLNIFLYQNSLELAAQVHTHPTEAYHSSTDDEYAIATTVGSFSIVVPNFAVVNYALAECAVYRLDAQGSWIDVDESQPPNRIVVF